MQLTVTTLIFGLPTGQRTVQTRLALPTATLTVGQLIACKVRQEVADCAAHRRPGLSGEYLSADTLLRAEAPEALVPGDSCTEIARAQRAFAARDYMVVIDNRRFVDAEAVVTLHPQTRVEFIKILPLVGG